jgi:hypothetical protein
MSEGEVLGKADGRMLGHAIDRIANLIEQAGRRDGVQEIAATAGDHARQAGARRIDVRHDIDLPATLPLRIGRRRAVVWPPAEVADARIGTEKSDRAGHAFGLVDDADDVVLPGDVTGKRQATDPVRYRLRARGVAIGHHDFGGAVGVKALTQRPADAIRSASDDNDFSGNLH